MIESDRETLDRMRAQRREQYRGVCPRRVIATWVPEKYELVDHETGDRWGFYLDAWGEIRFRRLT